MDEQPQEKSTAEKLGYPSDARLLIINADDFGMCHDENEATIEGLRSGIFSSSTILTTCPWFEEAANFARAELRGCANDPEQREADFRFFTSENARRLVADEGIKLIGYRELRDAMRGKNL